MFINQRIAILLKTASKHRCNILNSSCRISTEIQVLQMVVTYADTKYHLSLKVSLILIR